MARGHEREILEREILERSVHAVAELLIDCEEDRTLWAVLVGMLREAIMCVVEAESRPTVGAALVLTFFFGPLGLLYVSVLGGLLMIVVWIVVAIFTFGFGLIVLWPITMVWAAISASNHHSRHQAWLGAQNSPGVGARGRSAAWQELKSGDPLEQMRLMAEGLKDGSPKDTEEPRGSSGKE